MNVDQDAFWAHIEKTQAREAGVEDDGEYAYETFTNPAGAEVGFVSYRAGVEVAWTLNCIDPSAIPPDTYDEEFLR